jgi:hypothetical protein
MEKLMRLALLLLIGEIHPQSEKADVALPSCAGAICKHFACAGQYG